MSDPIDIAKRWLPLLDDYPPKRHQANKPFDQNFGTGTVPLCHARWVLEDIVFGRTLGVAELHRTMNFKRLAFVKGILFSFCIFPDAEVGQ